MFGLIWSTKADIERVFKSCKVDNICTINLYDLSNNDTKCLITYNEDFLLWHKRLGHVHFDLINKISPKNLVIGLPKIISSKEKLCNE